MELMVSILLNPMHILCTYNLAAMKIFHRICLWRCNNKTDKLCSCAGGCMAKVKKRIKLHQFVYLKRINMAE